VTPENGSEWSCHPPAGCNPSWELLLSELGWILLLHVYGFGFCFFVLSFYAFFSILNLR